MTLRERGEALRRVPVFAGVSGRALAQVARAATELELPAGQVLIEAGAAGAGMFVVLEGVAVVETKGRRRVELGPGECVGELALLTAQGVRTARVRAKTPLRCLAIARSDFRRLLVEEPRLALALLETLATRLAESG
ncbi:MAG TPA: cyclic nucleotide-binding domain-containing protein [Gaiellaceae bacterium]|nr:cyclic nucleotide-binding domain-containing protein [Gaiellaceae bacterium]